MAVPSPLAALVSGVSFIRPLVGARAVTAVVALGLGLGLYSEMSRPRHDAAELVGAYTSDAEASVRSLRKTMLHIVSFAAGEARSLPTAEAAAAMQSMAAHALSIRAPALKAAELPATHGLVERWRLEMALVAADFSARDVARASRPLEEVANGGVIDGEVLGVAATSADVIDLNDRLVALASDKEGLVRFLREAASGKTASLRSASADYFLESFEKGHAAALPTKALKEDRFELDAETWPRFPGDMEVISNAIKYVGIYNRGIREMAAAIHRGDDRVSVERIYDGVMDEAAEVAPFPVPGR